MNERNISIEKHDTKFKKIALVTMIVLLMAAIGTIIGSADSFYNIRIDYVFKDGTPAHDAYIATYRAGDRVDITVTNPSISGFTPMTAAEGGVSAATSRFQFNEIDRNVTETVYYVPGLTPYSVVYYKQNIYDDLYKRDNTVDAAHTQRYGYTGTNPTVLEEENLFEGFTNLFHEPDAIAADGSTEFRVYYDRNYYTILFNLGEGGYGVDPIYAKYETVYRIPEPTRMGYIFKGWARTDADSAKGEYGTDWHYINENGDEITEEEATANAFKLTQGEIPAKDQFFKAIWDAGTTSYSIVYWLEKPNSHSITADQINAMASKAEARALIAANYSVITAKDVENVLSGTGVNLDTMVPRNDGQLIQTRDFFSYDLSETGDFPSMSTGMRKELNGKGKYYDVNEDISSLQFGGVFEDDPGKTEIKVAGDGTTRINVYLDRKEFTLQFFYARQTADGTVYLTNSTKGFSKAGYKNSTIAQKLTISLSASNGAEWMQATDELPHIKQKYLDRGLEEKYLTVGTDKFWYYEVKANYNDVMMDEWFIDALTPVTKKDRNGQEMCRFGSWAVEKGTKYYNDRVKVNNNNFTIKGIYDRLGDDLMFEDDRANFTELHYLASWTNTDTRNPGNGWNYTEDYVYNFTYNSYIEILDWEYEYTDQELVDMGNYVDVITNGPRRYGLKAENIIETYDSGSQYKSSSSRDNYIRSDQTPAEIQGFEFLNDDIKAQYGFTGFNPTSSWYAKNDKDKNHHADVNFFYRRRVFTLKWRNGNRLEEEHTRSVKYGAPLNATYKESENGHLAGEYRYYYDHPEYFDPDLRDHYSFEGWYYTPYYYKELDINTATMPADDTTFYAKWDPKVINVSFYSNYNDFYQGLNRIGDEIPVNYGDFVPIDDIPANTDDPDALRPKLVPPTEGAKFAGWYYLRNNIPVRFEPEEIPVTALNSQAASEENAKLELFAEWATNDIAKYYITYVEKDHPENEVAQPYLGRSFLWKTRTVNAKTGDELNEAHKWTEDGQNWWPTTNSHSLIVEPNNISEESPYSPNTYRFEYIRKRGVYYRVEYRDSSNNSELAPPKDEVYSTHGSVKEDAQFVPTYIPDQMSKTLTLTASTAGTEAEQKAEELQNNVIVFYYHKNETEFLYEVEYYKQDLDGDGYFLYSTENRGVEIAASGDTTVEMQEIYRSDHARIIEDDGFERVAGVSTVTTIYQQGTTTTAPAPDNGSVVINGEVKTTVKIYFNRKTYPYQYQYVDAQDERLYLDTPEEDRGDLWNGLIASYDGSPQKVDSVVTIPAPTDIKHDQTPYIRIDDKEITLTISPVTEANPSVNTVKVYYKKFFDRELSFKLSCQNEGESGVRVDYDPITKQPLYGGLSTTLQTVSDYSSINPVTFYNFNDAHVDNSTNVEKYLHYHKYTFLGWFDNPKGTGTPFTMNEELTKEDMRLNETLPERDTTYYAVVREEMVTTNFELRCVDEELPVGTGDEAVSPADERAAAIVSAGRTDIDGSLTGCYIHLTDPLDYAVGAPIPWNKVEGYSLSIEPKDNKVYKYEFAEWWEEDLQTQKLIRKKEWNSNGVWSPTVLTSQLDRKQDRHVIAVFKKRELSELAYTINYHYIDRLGEERTYVKKGQLSSNQLKEGTEDCKITTDGDYRLTDSAIFHEAPFESNHGETLIWSNSRFEKTSVKGNEAAGTADRMITDVTAVQNKKQVTVWYRLDPDAEFTPIITDIGSNRVTDPQLAALDVRGKTHNGKCFSYWEIRKSADVNAPIIAKCYEPWFTYVVWEDYFITPVFDSDTENNGNQDADAGIILTAIDNTRNQWTDANGNMFDNASSDYLYCDFEVAFADGSTEIYQNTDYQAGLVFEICNQLKGNETFDPAECHYDTHTDNLKAAIKSILNTNPTAGGNGKFENTSGKNRSIQVNPISTEILTNRSRIEYAKPYRNVYKVVDGEKVYTNGAYIYKVSAYLIDKDDNVKLSEPVYACLYDVAKKDLATQD